MWTQNNKNNFLPPFAHHIIAPAALSFMLAATAATQDATAQSPVEQIESARAAEATGDLKKAKHLYSLVAKSSDVALAKEAGQKLAMIDRVLGGESSSSEKQDAKSNDRQGARSPVEARVLEEISKLQSTGGTREAFLGALQSLGTVAIPAIDRCAFLPGTYMSTRDLMVQALAQINSTQILGVFELWFSQGDELLQKACRDSLVKNAGSGHLTNISRREWTQFASRLVASKHEFARDCGVYLLFNRRMDDVVPASVVALVDDPSPNIRKSIAKSWYSLLAPEQLGALASDRDDSVRAALAYAIEYATNRADELEWINKMLRDPSDDVRYRMLRSIEGRLKSGYKAGFAQSLMEPLTAMVKDPSESVRSSLANVARALGPKGVPILGELAVDRESSENRKYALSVLAGYQDQRPERLEQTCTILERYLAQYEPGTDTTTPLVRWAAGQGCNTPADYLRVIKLLKQYPKLDNLEMNFGDFISRASRVGVPVRDVISLWDVVSQPRSREAILDVVNSEVGKSGSNSLEIAQPVLRDAFRLVLKPEFRGVQNFQSRAVSAALLLADKDLLPELIPLLRETLKTRGLQNSDTSRALESAMVRNPGFAARVYMNLIQPVYDINGQNMPNVTSYQATVLKGLGTTIQPGMGKDLLQYARDPERLNELVAANVQSNFVEAVFGLPKDEAYTVIEELAKLEKLKYAVMSEVGKMSGDRARDFLVSHGLAADAPSYVRTVAVHLLGKRNDYDSTTTAAVVRFVNDADEAMQSAIAKYCGRWKSPEAIQILRTILNSTFAGARKAAVNSMGALLSADATPDLIERLADDDNDVRVAAKFALEQIRLYRTEKANWENWNKTRGVNETEAAQKLIESLDDPAVDVRIAAIESISILRAKAALPFLVEKLKKTTAGPEREAISNAISKMNSN